MNVDDRAVIAANNNADLYAAMFQAHDLAYRRTPFFFVGDDPPPPYYSDLTVLAPGHVDEIDRQLDILTGQGGNAIGVKDSFCELNLEALGLEVLFRASWIWRDAGMAAAPANWHRVEDEVGLALWEHAWKPAGSATERRMFRPQMLSRPDIIFFGRRRGDVFEAGCIANRSADCLGLSNVYCFSRSNEAFAEATAAVASLDRSLPVVGYETGKSLEQARKAGFKTVGRLRILLAKGRTG